MRLLVDHDVIHKLAAFDLLPDALLSVSTERPSISVGETARFYFHVAKSPAKGRLRFGDAVHARIAQFLATTQTIADVMHADDIAALAGVFAIDPGEKLLFAVGSRDVDALVVTGDKRSLVALANAPTCGGIVQRSKGRIVIFEQVMLAAIAQLGFERVKQRVLANLTADKSLDAAFGSRAASEQAHVRATLLGYVNDVANQMSGLLATT